MIKAYLCGHEKETIIHRGPVDCLLRTRSNRHHPAPILPQETDTEPGKNSTSTPSQTTGGRYRKEEKTCQEDGF